MTRVFNRPIVASPQLLLWTLLAAGIGTVIPRSNLAAENAFKVGFGQVAINAPVGTPLAGYYHARGSDGVLDDLQAKTMLLDDGSIQVALVALDLISTTRSLVEEARAEIERRTGIPGSRVMISATHTHTAPELIHRGKRGEAMLADLPGAEEAAFKYSERLPGLIAQSVVLALSNAQPAALNVARGECPDLTFNRRFYMRDGSVGWNPGKLNPAITLPAGTTDPAFEVLLVEAPAAKGTFGAPLGAYVNYPLHPDTCGGTRLSADYPGALSRRMAEYHGRNFITVFANGACGNLNHIDVSWARPQQGPGEGNRIGTLLAASIFRAYKQLAPVNGFILQATNRIVQLPLREITPADIEDARKDIVSATDKTRDGFMRLVRAYRNLDIEERKGRPWEVEVQVFALGNDIAWVSLPGEIFVELGLAIKKHSPFPHTFIAELANGSIGYIPDQRSYAEGNYEPESGRAAPGSGELLVQAALKLLEALRKK